MNEDQVKMTSRLREDTAETSIDVIHKAVRISSYLPPFTSSTAHNPSRGYPPCLPPVPRPCNNSIASTSLHPIIKTNSATYSTGKTTSDVFGASRAMIWRGWSTIWMRYVAVYPFQTLCSGQRRLSIVSTLPVTLPGSVYTNSEVYAATI